MALTHVGDLPYDILALIFREVGTKDPLALLVRIPSTCRAWRYVCKHYSTGARPSFVFSVPPRPPVGRMLSHVKLESQQLETVCSSALAAMAVAGLHHLPESVSAMIIGGSKASTILAVATLCADKLTSLVLKGQPEEVRAPAQGHRIVRDIMATCPNLVHLRLDNVLRSHHYYEDDERIFDQDDTLLGELCHRYPKLQTLSLNKWRISAVGLAHLVSCKHLTKLDITKWTAWDHSVGQHADAVLAAIITAAPMLSMENIDSFGIGPACYAAEAEKWGPRKRQWSLYYGHEVEGSDIKSLLATCPNIQRIRLRAMKAWPMLSMVGYYENITHLDLYGFLRDPMVGVMFAACVQLEYLRLDWWHDVPNDVIDQIRLNVAPRLKTLVMSNVMPAQPFCEQTYGRLFDACTQLVSLDLANSYRPSGIPLSAVIDNITVSCQNLQRLVVTGQHNELRAERRMCLSMLPELRHLSIYDCRVFDRSVIEILWRSCAELESLEVQFTGLPPTCHLDRLLLHMPRLKRLEVRSIEEMLGRLNPLPAHCALEELGLVHSSTLTDCTVSMIMEHMPSTLRLLDVRHCRQLTRDGLLRLRSVYPNLCILADVMHANGVAEDVRNPPKAAVWWEQ